MIDLYIVVFVDCCSNIIIVVIDSIVLNQTYIYAFILKSSLILAAFYMYSMH